MTGCLGRRDMMSCFIYLGKKGSYSKHIDRHVVKQARQPNCKQGDVNSWKELMSLLIL
jgi:hypothetical protein